MTSTGIKNNTLTSILTAVMHLSMLLMVVVVIAKKFVQGSNFIRGKDLNVSLACSELGLALHFGPISFEGGPTSLVLSLLCHFFL